VRLAIACSAILLISGCSATSARTGSPEESLTNTEQWTTDWVTYSNAEFGYSLQYPPTMFWREWTPAADILHSVSFYDRSYSGQPLYQVPEIAVTVLANPDHLSLHEWLQRHADQAGEHSLDDSITFFENSTEPTVVVVDDTQALRFEEQFNGVRAERTILASDATVISILYTDFGTDRLASVYDVMISTFRRVEATSISAIDRCTIRALLTNGHLVV